jgi:hypothetical protein
MSNRKKMSESGYEETLILTNPEYDGAIIGVTKDGRAVYDYDKMVSELMKTAGLTQEKAVDFVENNTLRVIPYYGDRAPIVMVGIENLEGG